MRFTQDGREITPTLLFEAIYDAEASHKGMDLSKYHEHPEELMGIEEDWELLTAEEIGRVANARVMLLAMKGEVIKTKLTKVCHNCGKEYVRFRGYSWSWCSYECCQEDCDKSEAKDNVHCQR